MDEYNIKTHFAEFCTLLKEIEDFNNQGNYIVVKERLEQFNKFVKSIINKSEQILKNFNYNATEFTRQTETFYENFFLNFENNIEEIFFYLFNESQTPQIYRKKIYTLNHLWGSIESSWKYQEENDPNFLSIKPSLRIYFYLKLYLDYYESFALFLEPFILKIYQINRELNPRLTSDPSNLYPLLFSRMESGLDHIEDKKTNKKTFVFDYALRNIIAHSKYTIENNLLKMQISDRKDNIIDLNIDQIKMRYSLLANFIIIFTTKFDLEINEKFIESKESRINKHWSSYFDSYYKSWEEFHKNIFFILY